MKRTELQRGEPLKRTPMKRASPKGGRAVKPKPARTGLTEAEQAAVDRDGSECQRCKRHLEDVPASKHHRKRRREADADAVANIVLLCGSGTTGCHGYVHAHPNTARDEGWVLWTWDNPAGRPCLTAAGCTGVAADPFAYTSMVMYLKDGTKEEKPVPPIPAKASGDDWPMWIAT